MLKIPIIMKLYLTFFLIFVHLYLRKVMEGQLDAELDNSTDINVEDDNSQEKSSAIIKNPFQISVVIRCLLQYLPFKELKESRFVSKEWASVGLNVLIPRTKITFNRSLNGITKRRGPIQFFQVFPERDENNRTFSFNDFTFSGVKGEITWPIEELNYFFRNQQQFITKLNLFDLCLVDDDWKDIDSLDATPWISNSCIGFGTETSKRTMLTVDSNAFLHIKNLYLQRCVVNLQDGIRISPIEVNIYNSKFYRDKIQLSELRVNDFVDFCKAKKISLINSKESNAETETKLSLDLSGNHKLESLDLSETTLINLKTSNWSVDKLRLYQIPWTAKTQMQIKQLYFQDAQINISFLPQSLEKLNLDDYFVHQKITVTASQPIVLHNLKRLKLCISASCFSTFFQNVKCPNLVWLGLEKTVDDDVGPEFDLAWLTSTSLKSFRLTKITITNEENRHLNLDTLVLIDYRFSEMNTMLTTHIQTKELVLNGIEAGGGYDCSGEFYKLLETQKHFQDLGQRIYMSIDDFNFMPKVEGPVDDEDESKYCVFENNVGKIIHYSEYDDVLFFDLF